MTGHGLTILLVWVFQSFVSYGALNAQVQWDRANTWPSLNQKWRDDSGLVIFLSMLPVGIVIALTETNLCQHGWTLSTKNIERSSNAR